MLVQISRELVRLLTQINLNKFVTNKISLTPEKISPTTSRCFVVRVISIDNPDRFEQAFDQYYIPEVPENCHTRHFDGF